MPTNENNKFTLLRLCSFCRGAQSVGQTVYVAGPWFLCMVLAANLAVTVYSTHASHVKQNTAFVNCQIALNCLLYCPCHSLVEEQLLLFPCGRTADGGCHVISAWRFCRQLADWPLAADAAHTEISGYRQYDRQYNRQAIQYSSSGQSK